MELQNMWNFETCRKADRHVHTHTRTAGSALVERTRELYQAVDSLAHGISLTTGAVSPRRCVLQLSSGPTAPPEVRSDTCM